MLPPERVRSQLSDQRGGADAVLDDEGRRIGGARMTAVVTLKPGQRGRHYRLPTSTDYVSVRLAQMQIWEILDEWERGGRQDLRPVPDEPTPTKERHRAVGSQLPLYNMLTFGDLFTGRQKVALAEVKRLISKQPMGTVKELLALLVGRMADGNNSLARWESTAENPVNLFARQAIPMVWDFCESTPKSNARGVFLSATDSVCRVIQSSRISASGQVIQAEATNHLLPDQSAGVWFTDPPYYDAIPYADLSDFFLVWLKRTLPNHSLLRDPFDASNSLSHKYREAIQDGSRTICSGSKDRGWFERTMGKAFTEGRRVLKEEGVGSVVFAHQTTEGWEALLAGIVEGGWTVTGSWPIATESASRINARDTASLATSVHLILPSTPRKGASRRLG